jgi:hypothetical protein
MKALQMSMLLVLYHQSQSDCLINYVKENINGLYILFLVKGTPLTGISLSIIN